MPKLLVTLPESGEITHDLAEPTVTLGRLDDNSLQIEDPSVSSRHAQFTRSPDGSYELRDLNSTNGTRLNGEPVTEVRLRPGDRLRFGKVEALYQSDVPEENVVAAGALAEAAESQPRLPAAEETPVQVAAESHRPADFTNAAPFKKQERARDPVGRAILVLAVVALLLFLVALFFVFSLQPPANLPS